MTGTGVTGTVDVAGGWEWLRGSPEALLLLQLLPLPRHLCPQSPVLLCGGDRGHVGQGTAWDRGQETGDRMGQGTEWLGGQRSGWPRGQRSGQHRGQGGPEDRGTQGTGTRETQGTVPRVTEGTVATPSPALTLQPGDVGHCPLQLQNFLLQRSLSGDTVTQ